MEQTAVARWAITRVQGAGVTPDEDLLAVEEPLEVQLRYTEAGQPHYKSVAVTMRTPGNDAELATGFLFTEGIIQDYTQVASVSEGAAGDNRVLVKLTGDTRPVLQQSDRNFYMTSSCGVCGKASIDAIRTVMPFATPAAALQLDAAVLFRLPDLLREQQAVFGQTGGLHASALFDREGRFIQMREDVGRHNALDKLIGYALAGGYLPLHQSVLLLSGRASFELVQKAAMAGITIIAAVGAPSSLAVSLAEERGITLAGFLRNERFNIYSGAHRIIA
ncbi:formate dehydrogenase accessory sulfurtransferase FdhD [Taibaiella chishuiensis]|uniref:Sulfur carrier protein FdhD n=1 Tax=Taibaiella chishuiensis TaxID=1434707 RepID=A0A2P8CV11_9BACT|nr:formate dehydrogenase accessory sulfurtransferase FdhD [Taibaiella chishuiensis]PSK88811.1 FdhD protein [Taibaiella chishuiensis]